MRAWRDHANWCKVHDLSIAGANSMFGPNKARGLAARCVSIAIVLLGLMSCATGPLALEPPTVLVSGLTLLPMQDGKRNFTVSLLVTNSNDVLLELSHVDFTIRLGGEGFVEGRVNAPPSLPPGEQVRMRTDVATDFVSSVSRLTAYLQGPESTLPYEANGQCVLASRPPRFLSFTSSGQVPLIMSSSR